MRNIFTILLLLFALTFTSCSYALEYVVVNESERPIEVRCKIYALPDEPNPLINIGPLSTMNASRLRAGSDEWRELSVTEYQFYRENSMVIVRVMPGEALLLKRSSTSRVSFPIVEVTIVGADGEISFRGEQAFRAFIKETDRLRILIFK